MFIHPDQKAPVARLLQFLRDGEYLASDCAKAQSKLTTDPLMRRFLLSQARQESYHALVFQGNIAWLAPRHLGAGPLLPPLERYRTLIEEAIGRGDFAETLMAEQIILEGLGAGNPRAHRGGTGQTECPLRAPAAHAVATGRSAPRLRVPHLGTDVRGRGHLTGSPPGSWTGISRTDARDGRPRWATCLRPSRKTRRPGPPMSSGICRSG